MQIKRKNLAGLGIFGFLGRVVLSHPSEGSLSSRLILHDRGGEWRGAVYSAGGGPFPGSGDVKEGRPSNYKLKERWGSERVFLFPGKQGLSRIIQRRHLRLKEDQNLIFLWTSLCPVPLSGPGRYGWPGWLLPGGRRHG